MPVTAGRRSIRGYSWSRPRRDDASRREVGGIACSVFGLAIVKANMPRNYWSGDQLSTCGQDIMPVALFTDGGGANERRSSCSRPTSRCTRSGRLHGVGRGRGSRPGRRRSCNRRRCRRGGRSANPDTSPSGEAKAVVTRRCLPAGVGEASSNGGTLQGEGSSAARSRVPVCTTWQYQRRCYGSTVAVRGPVNARLCDLAHQVRSKVGSAPNGPRSQSSAVNLRAQHGLGARAFRASFSDGYWSSFCHK